MAVLAALFEADGLAALGACGADKAARPVVFFLFALEVAIFQNTGDGIGNGKYQTAILENGVLATDALELINNILGLDSAAQGQGNQPADGFGLGRLYVTVRF